MPITMIQSRPLRLSLLYRLKDLPSCICDCTILYTTLINPMKAATLWKHTATHPQENYYNNIHRFCVRYIVNDDSLLIKRVQTDHTPM